MSVNKPRAVVVFSGGQDSVTCLGVAMRDCAEVFAISFSYGQRHSVELDQAAKICQQYSIEHKIIDLSFLGELVTSALTGEGDVSKSHEHNAALPASFVPNRNALMVTVAHAYAQEVGASVLYTGVCQTDYSGYPDCRAAFIMRLRESLNVGYETSIAIRTPLMYLTKAETFALADEVGILETVINKSHTCYEGDHETFNDWGYGCGTCPACQLRAKGWKEYRHGIAE